MIKLESTFVSLLLNQVMRERDNRIGTCIAFDYGTRRIGLAVGEYRLKTASPVGVVNNNNGTPDWSAIDKIIELWQPTDLVVGWPLTEDSQEQTITFHVKGFIKRLNKRYELTIHKADERYSSVEAQQTLKNMRSSGQRIRKTRHEDVDTIAAALILESWFATGSSQ
ncbi:MAG: putative Holliday junction resolvase [Granulosicoccus sp.]